MKGFGSYSKKKTLKDSRYLKFYNEEKLANTLLRNKNIKEAKKVYLELLKNGFQSFNIFFNLGFIVINEKNYKDAIKYLTKAKSLSKENNVELILGLVNSYLSLKEIKKARLILDEAIIKDSKSELLLFNYAKVEEDLLY